MPATALKSTISPGLSGWQYDAGESGSSTVLYQQLHEILERWQALVACCLSDALSSGEIRSDMNNTQLAAIFWSSWEGAVMRAKLYCSTQPVYDFWSYFKKSVRYQPSKDTAVEK
nr:TetR family transcriptional regulator C-terminal domain-containing protein [Enterobacter hormaechei]